VRVLHDLEDVDFSANPLYVCDIRDFRLFKNFDGDLFIGRNMAAQLDFAKSALSDRFTEDVVAYLALVGSEHDLLLRLWILMFLELNGEAVI
jgi:hypothetical protein